MDYILIPLRKWRIRNTSTSYPLPAPSIRPRFLACLAVMDGLVQHMWGFFFVPRSHRMGGSAPDFKSHKLVLKYSSRLSCYSLPKREKRDVHGREGIGYNPTNALRLLQYACLRGRMRFFLKRWEPSRKLTRACQSEIAYLPLIRFTSIILVVALSFPVFYFIFR